MHLPKTPISYFRGDPWTIVEEGFDSGPTSALPSPVFSAGERVHGVRGYFEEGYSGDHLLGSYFTTCTSSWTSTTTRCSRAS